MKRLPRQWPRLATGPALLVAGVVSLVGHGLGYWVIQWRTTLPDPGIEFQLPSEVELGLVDEGPLPSPPTTSPAAAGAAPTPAEPLPAHQASPAPSEPHERERDAGLPAPTDPKADAGPATPPDAGPPAPSDAGTAEPPDAAPTGDAEPIAARVPPPDADTGRTSEAAAKHESSKREPSQHEPEPSDGNQAPPGAKAARSWQPRAASGAMVALRLDLAEVRRSDLKREVAEVVHALPDVKALLDGTRIDIVQDLNRLLVASPDLSRARALIAGVHRGPAEMPRKAAARLASGSGRGLRAEQVAGLVVLPWYNHDPTPRVVALLGSKRFAIARRADLPRVLAIDRALSARAQDGASTRQAKGEGSARTGAGLLGMPEGVAGTLEVEGVPHFVRRARGEIPRRLEAQVRMRPRRASGGGPQGEVAVSFAVHLDYDTAEAAVRAATQLRELLDRAGRNPLVRFTGLGSILTAAELVPEDSRVTLRSGLSALQAKTVLGMLRDALRPPSSSGGGTLAPTPSPRSSP